jgi:hypothetical protein
MKSVLKGLVVLIAALVAFSAGATGAWVYAGTSGRMGVESGPGAWRTSKGTGDASAGLVQRATVARQGLWALPQSEVIYFRAITDDEGVALSNRCTYEIARQEDPPTRWWSVTLYRNLFWVDNDLDRYSWTSTNLIREDDGGYRIILSKDSQPGNWLPMGEEDGGFSLIFRNYQPDPSIALDPKSTPLPAIRRVSCD